MGTRGFTGFVVDEDVKISYQQFDSYPSGVGVEVLGWLRLAVDSVTAMRDRVRAIEVVDGRTPPTPEQIAKYKKYADLGVSSQSLADWYCLLRNTQGQPAGFIDAGVMLDAGDFPLDSLFCEWGYLIDLDNETFEVYRGFQQTIPTTGRWAGRPTPEEEAEGYAKHVEHAKSQGREPWKDPVEKYKAVTLQASWPLKALPTDEAFLQVEKDVYGEDDDE